MVSAVMRRDRRLYVYDDLFEEAVSEALLSWMEGEDPMSGIDRVRKASQGWKHRHITGDGRVTSVPERTRHRP